MNKSIGRMNLDQITRMAMLCRLTECGDCLLAIHKPDLCNFLKDFERFRKKNVGRREKNVFKIKINIDVNRLEGEK